MKQKAIFSGLLFLFEKGRGTESCGFQPGVKGASNNPGGVFARGGDTAPQRRLGSTPTSSFRDGIAKAQEFFQ